MELDQRARTRERIREKYPECSSNSYRFSSLLQELRSQGFPVRSNIAGALLETQDHFSFECHVTDEEMRFYTFTGTRGIAVGVHSSSSA